MGEINYLLACVFRFIANKIANIEFFNMNLNFFLLYYVQKVKDMCNY